MGHFEKGRWVEDANKAVKQGLMQIGWGDWEFDTCKEITDSGVIE